MSDSYNGREVFVIDIDGQRSDPLTPNPPYLQEQIERLRQQLFGRSVRGASAAPNEAQAGQPADEKDS